MFLKHSLYHGMKRLCVQEKSVYLPSVPCVHQYRWDSDRYFSQIPVVNVSYHLFSYVKTRGNQSQIETQGTREVTIWVS